MIGKPIQKRSDGKSSFKQLIDYMTSGKSAKGQEKVEYSDCQNVLNLETAVLEMDALASENKRCKDPAFHFILSFRELEIPTNEQVDEAVKIALKELDLNDCQAVWSLHRNTENRHIHVAVNRIDPETLKAIQPANNFTILALERAARKIEIAQGWDIEQTGSYTVTGDGQIVEKEKNKNAPPPLSSGARDSEAHTAAKSAERIGQEIAAPIIREAKSWDELHEKLAQQGISFEKKGSGAILKIGDTVIKASVAGRDISLSKLTAKLGEYIPRDSNIQTTPREQPEPIEKVKPEVRGTWKEYQKLRTEYFTNKNESYMELRQTQKKEIDELSQKHRNERAAIFNGVWKGRGQELNQLRSITAARQKAEQLNTRDKHSKERIEFKENFPRTFLSFKDWLQKDNRLAVEFRYQRNQPVMLKDEKTTPRPDDLRAFVATAGNRGGVAYARENNNKAGFLDYGKRILLSERYDETSILAALQLASQKWGSVSLKGTDEYKQLCVQIAMKNNIKITNPELQNMIKEQNEMIKNTAKTENMINTFNAYANAVGAEKFRIVVTEFKPDGVQAFIMDRANDGKTNEEIISAIPKLESYTKYNKNINVVPLSDDKHHILVDDVTQENLNIMRNEGYHFACVIESSPNNYQVILNVPKLEGDDRTAANKLTKDLNIKYGDPKLSGAIHAHRLPPFENFKLKHQRADGTFPSTQLVEAEGGICKKTFEQLEQAASWIKETESKTILKKDSKLNVSWEIGAVDHNGAYWAHYKDIVSKQKGEVDYSRLDSMIGVRMRVTGYSPSQVKAAIEENAPLMRKENMTEAAFNEKYRGRDWHRFAKETTEQFIFGARGTIQYSQAERYRPLYMKLEGRNVMKEITQFNEIERNKTKERDEQTR